MKIFTSADDISLLVFLHSASNSEQTVASSLERFATVEWNETSQLELMFDVLLRASNIYIHYNKYHVSINVHIF